MERIDNWRKPSKEEIGWALGKLHPYAEFMEGGPVTVDGWKAYVKSFLRIVQPVPLREDRSAPEIKIYHPVPLEEAVDALLSEMSTVMTRFPKPRQLRKIWMQTLCWPAADGREISAIEDEYGDR